MEPTVLLSKIYIQLNRLLFQSALPVVKFELRLNRKCILDFRHPKTIEIGSEFAGASTTQVLDELVHCMIHLKNRLSGISDHTQNQYHNRVFKETALQLGFYVVSHKHRGWAVTCSQRSRVEREERVISPEAESHQQLLAAFAKVRPLGQKLVQLQKQLERQRTQKPVRQTLLRYECQCDPPFNTIRSGRSPDGLHPLLVRCEICRSLFALSD